MAALRRLTGRLAFRLAAAMVSTMLLTLLIFAGTQQWAEYRAWSALSEDARLHVPGPRPFDSLFGPLQRQPQYRPVTPPTSMPDSARGFIDFRRYQNESFLLAVGIAALASVGLELWL